jgi:hypothetical protein
MPVSASSTICDTISRASSFVELALPGGSPDGVLQPAIAKAMQRAAEA